MLQPNCYECKWRRNISGDCHSTCYHPSTGNNSLNMFDGIINMINGQYGPAAKQLNIKANQHGVNSGWFFWPTNYDPIWLENCDGFEKIIS